MMKSNNALVRFDYTLIFQLLNMNNFYINIKLNSYILKISIIYNLKLSWLQNNKHFNRFKNKTMEVFDVLYA